MIDRANNYSGASGQTLTATGLSTDKVDHKVAAPFAGAGEPMVVCVVLRSAPSSNDGDETYTVKVQTDSDEALGSAADLTPAYTIPRASAAGTKFLIPIPPNATFERYTGLLFTLGGTTPSITYEGWITSWRGVQNDAYYADAITIG